MRPNRYLDRRCVPGCACDAPRRSVAAGAAARRVIAASAASLSLSCLCRPRREFQDDD